MKHACSAKGLRTVHLARCDAPLLWKLANLIARAILHDAPRGSLG